MPGLWQQPPAMGQPNDLKTEIMQTLTVSASQLSHSDEVSLSLTHTPNHSVLIRFHFLTCYAPFSILFIVTSLPG